MTLSSLRRASLFQQQRAIVALSAAPSQCRDTGTSHAASLGLQPTSTSSSAASCKMLKAKPSTSSAHGSVSASDPHLSYDTCNCVISTRGFVCPLFEMDTRHLQIGSHTLLLSNRLCCSCSVGHSWHPSSCRVPYPSRYIGRLDLPNSPGLESPEVPLLRLQRYLHRSSEE